MIFYIFFILIFLTYFGLLLWICYGMNKLETNSDPIDKVQTGFSIVVPFRNEAENLPVLLNSIADLNYPDHLYELLLVNDNSEDDYMPVIDDFRRKNSTIKFALINARADSSSPKKEAIELAVSRADFDWIITTDADCELPKQWLNCFSDASKHGNKLIAGPVLYRRSSGIIDTLQYYDLLALQGLGMGGFGMKKPFLCSGANLAFSKSFFLDMEGFRGNLDSVSGDDLFMLKKALDHDTAKVSFLKDKAALIMTKPVNNWLELLHQRVRWITKTRRVGNKTGSWTSLTGLMANLFLLTGLLMFFAGNMAWEILLFASLLKITADYTLISTTARILGQRIRIHEIFLISLFYPFFVILVCIRSIFPLFRWKGRSYTS